MDMKATNDQEQKQGSGPVSQRGKRGFSFHHMRLQTRLTLLVLVISVPILLSLSIVSTVRSSSYLQTNVNDQLQQANASLLLKAGVWFEMHTNLVKQIASLPDIASMDPERQKPVLVNTVQAFPSIFLVHTLDAQGFDVARNDDNANRSYGDRQWFQNALAGQVAYEAIISRTTNKPSLAISAPILDADGKIVGVASTTIDIGEISQDVLKGGGEGLQSHPRTILVDGSNKVLAHPDTAVAEAFTDYSAYPPVAALRQGTSGIFEYQDANGQDWLAYLTSLDNGWAIVTEVETVQAFAPIMSYQLASGALSLLAGLLLVLLSVFMIRRALRPIHELTETAVSVAAGDIHREARVDRDDEIGDLARAFNDMNRQLRGSIGLLEQRVAERTRMVEISGEISRRLSTIMNPTDLVHEVVTELKDAFGYYHVHIYLFDETKENLIMVGGTGEAGQVMLARGHKIPTGKGLVGRAADTNAPVLVNDTREDAAWLPNPLLPETRSELSMPIAIGNQVLGVLDVQEDRVNGLSHEDQQILQSVADQVGIAVQNARAYALAQQQAHHQEVISTIGQRIQRAASVDEVLQIAVSELGRALGAQRSSVELRSPAAPNEQKNELPLG